MRAWLAVKNTVANCDAIHFAYYDDDNVDVDSNTIIGSEDTAMSRGTGTANRFIIRFKLTQTNDSPWAGNAQLQVSYKGGAYTDVNASSSYVQATAALWDDTSEVCATERLTGTAQGFSGTGETDDTDGNIAGWVIAKSIDEECAWCVYIVDGDVDNADTLDFQAVSAGETLTNNFPGATQPRVTVSKTPEQTGRRPAKHAPQGLPHAHRR
jgi:hypothetical protein